MVDIQEDEKEFAIVAELPGLKPEQVEVTCQNARVETGNSSSKR